MAIIDENLKQGLDELGAGPSVNQNTSNTGNTDASNGVGNFIGFGGREVFTMTTNLGSEYVNKLSQSIVEVYKQLPVSDRPKVSILDKTVIGNLGYSSIVIHHKTTSGVVNYFIALLEGTGDLPKTAEQIIAEVSAASKQTGQIPYVFTTSDAIDSILHDEVIRALTIEYNNRTEFKSVDAVVVPATQHENENIVINIAAIGFNAVTIDGLLSDGKVADFNITLAKKKSPNTMLRFDSNMFKQTVANEVDAPIRADWQIELNAISANNNIISPNMRDGKIKLTHVAGFTDAIPEEIAVPTMPGMPVTTQLRLHPHHIVTSNGVQTPTPAMMLLGVVSSLVMTNESMWLAALLPEDGKKVLHNTGALNLITNLENEQNGIGKPLDLSKNKLTVDGAYALIKQMFSLGSIVSYDVESYGPQTYYTSALAVAAEPGNSQAKLAAASDIIDAANWLTNGNFPSDFNPNEIFTTSGVVVPLGKWSDKTGERDIRDIDLSFIATNSGEIDTINKWALSSLPKEATGMDPYLTKVEIIAKLIPTAVITGKAVRVTFTDKFITTLINAATNAGLDAIYEPAVKFAETNNLGIISNYFANASVQSGNVGFARQQMASGPVYTTPYTTTGYNRY